MVLKAQPTLAQLVPIPIADKKWLSLGVALRVPSQVLQSIQSKQQNDHKKRLMYRQWLELFPKGKWSDVITALNKIGEGEAAGRVREEYGTHRGEQQRVPETTATSVPLPAATVTTSLKGSQTAPFQNLPSKTGLTSVATPATPPQVDASRGDDSSLTPPTNVDTLPLSSPSSYQSAHSNVNAGDTSPFPPSSAEISPRSPTRPQPLRTKTPASSKRCVIPSNGSGSRLSSTPHTPQPPEPLPAIKKPWQSGTQTATPLPRGTRSKSPVQTTESSPQTQIQLTGINPPPLPPSHTHPDPVSLSQLFRDAVREYDAETVERVLGRGGVEVDMVISEEDGRTALMMASAADKPDVVRALLKHRAATTTRDKDGFTPLHLACSHGNYEVMKLLVEAFADVNSIALDGTPMLLKPAQKGFSMVTQYLLENNADPNIADRDGVTPLMAAAMRGQRDVVKVLLASGADVTAVSVKSSRTALQEAIDREHQEIVPLLMKAMAEAKEKSQGLFTCKTAETVRKLVQDKAKVDERRGDEATPLMAQVDYGNEEVVKELLAHSANVDLQDKDGLSALMRASISGQVNMVQMLIAHRAILDLKSKSGYTALMYAVQRGHVRVARELLLAGADPTAKDKGGLSVLELSRETRNKEMIEELEKHSTMGDTKDPFIHLLSGYLDNFSAKHKEQQQNVKDSPLPLPHPPKDSPPTTHKEISGPPGATGATGVAGDDSAVKEDLSKAYKRIADLETRVHDLTLQSTMELSDETDLSYYDRGRLEAEFRKLKEMKRKAEQYAVEAKQTAQRLSAENFKLREDLSRERHYNELERKNMLREMEQHLGKKDSQGDKADAKMEVMEEEIKQRARDIVRSLPGPLDKAKMLRVEVQPETLKELILNQKIRANMLLIVTAGLPYSGKSTLISKVLGSNTPTDHHGLTVYDALLVQDKVSNRSTWMAADKDQSELFAVTAALMQVSMKRREVPSLSSHTEFTKRSTSFFGDQKIDLYFDQLVNSLGRFMSDLEAKEKHHLLTTSALTFMNVWDVGVNRGVYEVLSMLAPHCSNLLLLNTFSLTEDAENLHKVPDLSSPHYNGRYEERGDHRSLLRLQTKPQYLFYPMCVCSDKEESTVLVGIHHSHRLSPPKVKERSDKVLQTIKVEAEYHSRAHCLVPSVVAVDPNEKEDIQKLQKMLEYMIEKGSRYEVDLPLSWVFLHCFLASTQKIYLTMPELVEVARKCSISKRDDVDEFVKLFSSCGSLLHISNLCPECADEYIVLRPAEFLKEIDKLYYIHRAKGADGQPIDIPRQPHLNPRLGYVSVDLAQKLWSEGNRDDQMHKFFLHALRRLGILAAMYKGKESPRDAAKYFMASIRRNPNTRSLSSNSTSLYLILHSFLLPFPLQSEFFMHFQVVHPQSVTFKPTNSFNTLTFTWETQEEQIDFDVSFMGEYVEVSVETPSLALCSMLKTACVQVMDHIQHSKPELKLDYRMAIMCPHGTGRGHFCTFHPLEDGRELSCDVCHSVAVLEGLGAGEGGRRGGGGREGRGDGDRKEGDRDGGGRGDGRGKWLQAAYTGPVSLVQGPSDVLQPSEAVSLANALSTLSPGDLASLASAMGFQEEEVEQRRQFCSCSQRDLLLGLLLEYSRRTPYHVKRRLARVLMSSGYLTEALVLDPTALECCTASQSDPLSVPELRAVSLHLPQWEEIGERLGVPAEVISQIRESSRTTQERAYRMLQHWREEIAEKREVGREGGGRQVLKDVLEAVGCEKSAEFLAVGSRDMLWK